MFLRHNFKGIICACSECPVCRNEHLMTELLNKMNIRYAFHHEDKMNILNGGKRWKCDFPSRSMKSLLYSKTILLLIVKGAAGWYDRNRISRAPRAEARPMSVKSGSRAGHTHRKIQRKCGVQITKYRHPCPQGRYTKSLNPKLWV